MQKHVSVYSPTGNLNTFVGYGVALYEIITALQRLGWLVEYDQPRAPVQINFCQPEYAKFNEGQRQILYFPWESTVIPDSWRVPLAHADSVLVTSDWVRWVAMQNGVRVDGVFPHGITDIWSPVQRPVDGTFRFFHHGEPASRKGGQLVYDAFVSEFGPDDDVSLTIKARGWSEVRDYVGSSNQLDPRVTVDTRELQEPDLVAVYHNHHACVYPTWGEGWGLIPFQAAATGMQVATTIPWCHYWKYVEPILSSPAPSPWPTIHPGEMYEPSLDDIKSVMRHMYEHRDALGDAALSRADLLHQEYEWTKIVEENLLDFLL